MPDDKFVQIPVHREVREKLDKMRQRRAKTLGLTDLSWNQFVEMLIRDIEKGVEA